MNLSLAFRKIKTAIKIGLATIKYPFVVKKYKLPYIMSIEESLHKVVSNKLSVARFGDSEYMYLTGRSDGLQTSNLALKTGLGRALLNRNPKLLVCLVDYENLADRTTMARLSGKLFHTRTIAGYHHLLDPTYTYGDSNMTRFYMGKSDKKKAKSLFDLCKQLWKGRDVVIFEGQNTRFGYGNDLFDNALSVHRVLCPSKGAFEYYHEIIDFAKTIDASKLLIFALGASATVAASDLTDLGYQVLDIGNLDIEYEWYLKGATTVVKIENKQVSEVYGGTKVKELNDINFKKEILYHIGL